MLKNLSLSTEYSTNLYTHTEDTIFYHGYLTMQYSYMLTFNGKHSIVHAMNINVKINKNVFNKSYLPFLNCQTRTQHFFGGSSAGKSIFCVGQRSIYDVLKGGRNYLIVRNVARTSRQSTFNEVCKTITNWNLEKYFKINKSDLSATCINGYQILFAGLDDVQKLKSLTPAKGVLTDILIDEATETQESDIKELEKRLRGKSGVKKRLTLIYNPILRSHWLYQNYFVGKFKDDDKKYHDKNLLIYKATYKDNLRFLEQDDVDALENETDEYYYNVYTLGNFGVMGGVIFTNWRTEDLSEQVSKFDNIRNGLDFGFSQHPSALVRVHYDSMRKKIYIFEGKYEYGCTNQDLADILKPMVNNELVICDSAEPKSIQELANYGINTDGAKKGKGSINFGIQWLKQNEIIIDRNCQDIINEFQQYQWKKDKNGDSMPKPVDKSNHCIDALRYALEDEMNDDTQIFIA